MSMLPRPAARHGDRIVAFPRVPDHGRARESRRLQRQRIGRRLHAIASPHVFRTNETWAKPDEGSGRRPSMSCA